MYFLLKSDTKYFHLEGYKFLLQLYNPSIAAAMQP